LIDKPTAGMVTNCSLVFVLTYFGFTSIQLDGRAEQTNHWHWLFFAFLLCCWIAHFAAKFSFLGELINMLTAGMVANC